MTQINLGRTVRDKTKQGVAYEFTIPDLARVMNTHVQAGDEILMPVNVREDQVTFWESGGRNPAYISSIGTIITDSNDKLLDAVLFNKLKKIPNGKQALIPLKSGYRLYAGKISIRHNELSPNIKIIRFVYTGIDSSISTKKVTFGRFVVDELFNNYSETIGCFPCERLLKKLFSKNVIKPFFANGWTISNIKIASNKIDLRKAYLNIMGMETTEQRIDDGDLFIDTLEEAIVRTANKKLSAVYQCIDFETGMVYVKPMSNMALTNIAGSIAGAATDTTYAIPINNLMTCYNKNIIFNSDDIRMLEMALSHDDKYAVNVGDRKFVIMRGYRG